MLTKEGCQLRQQRLSQRLAEKNIDAILLSHPLEIYYFTGMLLPQLPAPYPICLFMETGGPSWLVAHTIVDDPCVDETLIYPWNVGYTMSPDLETQMNRVVALRLQNTGGTKRLGYQADYQTHQLTTTFSHAMPGLDWLAVDPLLNDLQKCKDPDEIELIRQSIRADLAAYSAARKAIAPNINELEVLGAAQQAACLEVGEKIFHDGDYSCNAMGGFARNRKCQAGELYVIDAWSIYRGYWADLCRTFAVSEPTDIQQSIFDHLKSFHQLVPNYLRPGQDGTELFLAMDAHIRQHPALADIGLVHHAGHNVGLRAHQMPDLNLERGGTLAVGNVVSIEPGAYIPAARAGVRLENMYLITADGVENLSDYPMELT